MKKNPTFVLVVAAAILDGESRILLQQGLPGKRHAGLWEFPGGKVDTGELPRDSLAREIREELGLVLDPEALSPMGFAEENGSDGHSPLVLILYKSAIWSGMPEAREGQVWAWFTLAEANRLPLAAMDRALMDKWLQQQPA